MTIKRGTARRLGLRQPPTMADDFTRHDGPGWGSAWLDVPTGLTEQGITIRRGRTDPNGHVEPTTVTLDNTGSTWMPDQPLRRLGWHQALTESDYWTGDSVDMAAIRAANDRMDAEREDPRRESRRERRKRLGLHWWQRERVARGPIGPGWVDLQEESGNTLRGGPTE